MEILYGVNWLLVISITLIILFGKFIMPSGEYYEENAIDLLLEGHTSQYSAGITTIEIIKYFMEYEKNEMWLILPVIMITFAFVMAVLLYVIALITYKNNEEKAQLFYKRSIFFGMTSLASVGISVFWYINQVRWEDGGKVVFSPLVGIVLIMTLIQMFLIAPKYRKILNLYYYSQCSNEEDHDKII